jgi:hypothetical protein
MKNKPVSRVKIKRVGIVLGLLLCVTLFPAQVVMDEYTNYKYQKAAYNFWEMSCRSSTLSQKAEYVDKFVKALETIPHSEYNALFLKTPELNFEENLKALKSFNERLHTIKDWNELTFSYQVALQQITEQEQGSVKVMLTVPRECFVKNQCIFVWSYIGFFISFVLLALLLLASLAFIIYMTS